MQQLLNQYKYYLKGSRTDLKTSLVPNHQGSRTDLKRNSWLQAKKGSPAGERSVLNGKPRPLSPSTIKNYLSDTKHFLTYLKTTLQEPSIKPPHITSTTCQNYLNNLSKTSPSATLKRRFSALKRFTSFLYLTKLLDSNPLKHLSLSNTRKNTSTTKILTTFKNFLKSEGLSNSTIKNYASDINHYLLWANKNINTTDKHFQTR
ncbi:MAG: site-specific integrase [Patescibacteria group bacterium]|nr:site-specific integrase [Patescibacteria group bacterium]